jgi:SAM-dependent methyltransferase
VSSAANSWREKLEAWAIPKEIIDQAETSPWIHPPSIFQLPDHIQESPSQAKALEAMPPNGSVLDIGCGGGIGAFALTGKISRAIGVDHQQEMLDMFKENANSRNITTSLHLGFWPALEKEVEIADVVVVHHVLYNVQDVIPFIRALNSHANKRVVIEIPQTHPLSTMNAAWKHFWNLDRPTDPTPQDLMAVLAEMGIEANLQLWEGEMRMEQETPEAMNDRRIRLCLPTSKLEDVSKFFKNNKFPKSRPLATIWWDTI